MDSAQTSILSASAGVKRMGPCVSLNQVQISFQFSLVDRHRTLNKIVIFERRDLISNYLTYTWCLKVIEYINP
jgi:hypothetical protein